METWITQFRRPLCVFRTKQDFKITGRRYNVNGVKFLMDNSEYADDTAVFFESKNRTAEEIDRKLDRKAT